MAAEAFTGSVTTQSFAFGQMVPRYLVEFSQRNGYSLTINPTTNLYTCSKSGVPIFSNFTQDQVLSLWKLLAENASG